MRQMSISGDYVDFIKINDRQMFIFLGDVSVTVLDRDT